ncbi:MAG: hypothetical protein ACTSYE_00620, partial [Alphaproteobacteria bacterium]
MEIEMSYPHDARCLLTQALLWTSRGARPVSIDEFLAAPDEVTADDIEMASPLLRHLGAGRIVAEGDLQFYAEPYYEEAGINPDWEPPAPEFIRHEEVPTFAFSARTVDFKHNT